jgi:hypothetical protein
VNDRFTDWTRRKQRAHRNISIWTDHDRLLFGKGKPGANESYVNELFDLCLAKMPSGAEYGLGF